MPTGEFQSATQHQGFADPAIDESAVAERIVVRGEVLKTLSLPLPRRFVDCDLKESVWPNDVELFGIEFEGCELEGAVFDQCSAPNLRIASSSVSRLSMKNGSFYGLAMRRVSGKGVSLRGSNID